MDKNVSQCRLCLSKSSCFLNTFTKINDTTIASILNQHFWFEVKEDGTNVVICQDCWLKVEDFHLFYTKVYNIHFELISKVEPKIKVEAVGTSDKIELINCLEENYEIKTEYNQDAILSDKDDENTSSDLNFDPFTNLNGSENGISSSDSDEDFLLSKRNSEIKCSLGARKRKTKPVKTTHLKKEINPIEQRKIDQQNKEISEFFSMVCELCAIELDSFRNLQSHYRMEHSVKGYVRCCNRKYAKRIYIIEHLSRHLNPDTFRCELCNKNFSAKRSLELHLLRHVPKNARPHKCPECSKTYITSTLLTRHLQTHTTDKKFVCSECGRSYISDLHLKNHLRNMHSEKRNYICDVCAKPFRSKGQFEMHHKTVHGKVPQPKVNCNVCGAWVLQYTLRQHMMRHPNSNTTFSCNICGKSAPNVRALQSHMRVVHTEKIYDCKLCEKTFKRPISLKEHMASHTGDILYSCSYCSKTFNSSANMYSHKKKIHIKEWKEQKLEKLKGD